MPLAKKFLVSGRVQGVFYRGSTQQQAEALQLLGYAKNLPNGKVVVLAIGDIAMIDKLQAWLWMGPSCADVSNVEELPLPDAFNIEQYCDFVTGVAVDS